MACGCSYLSRLPEEPEGITLAGKFDLINVGMACKNLVCIKCIFQERKSFGLDQERAPQSHRKKKTPAGAHIQRQNREREESGSSIYNAVMKLGDGDNMQRCSAHIIGGNN